MSRAKLTTGIWQEKYLPEFFRTYLMLLTMMLQCCVFFQTLSSIRAALRSTFLFSWLSRASQGSGSYERRYKKRLTSVMMNISMIIICWLSTENQRDAEMYQNFRAREREKKKDKLCGQFLQEPRAWEENGGAQAMVPSRERMLMIDVCSWLKMRTSWAERRSPRIQVDFVQSVIKMCNTSENGSISAALCHYVQCVFSCFFQNDDVWTKW